MRTIAEPCSNRLTRQVSEYLCGTGYYLRRQHEIFRDAGRMVCSGCAPLRVRASSNIQTQTAALRTETSEDLMIVAGILFVGVKWTEWQVARRSQLRKLAIGQFETFEGTIEDFHPALKGGNTNESFAVSGHHFSYSDYDGLEATPCFNQTALNGGPIRSGMVVRLKASEGCILRIEVLRESSSAKS